MHTTPTWLEAFRITKPAPIVQSSSILSATVQGAIATLAQQKIQEEQATAKVGVNTSAGTRQENSAIADFTDSVRVAIATNPADREKIRLEAIDRKIDKLVALLEGDKSDKAVESAVALIANIGQETGKVVSDPATQSDREVLTLLIAQYNRLQLDLQKLEDKLPIDAYLKVEDARVKHLLTPAQQSLNSAPNLGVVNNIGLLEVRKIVGDDFAELKAIEILTDLGNGLNPQTKVSLNGIQKELALQFEKRMLKLPVEARNRKLQDYIKYSFGNPLLQAKAFENTKNFLTDREMILSADSLKELALQKLETRVFEIGDQNTLNKFCSGINWHEFFDRDY